MAQKVDITIVDDLDGSTDDVETILFGLDGATYEIDLSDSNARALRESLASFIGAGRRSANVRRNTGARPSRSITSTGPDAKAVRTWARENGVPVSERGRVHPDVVAEYERAGGRPVPQVLPDRPEEKEEEAPEQNVPAPRRARRSKSTEEVSA